MNLPNAVASVLRNYVNFSGRASRSEYWYWTLAYMLLMMPLAVIDQHLNRGTEMGKMSLVVGLLSLALFLPNLAVTIRRLHDTDHSGWWILLSFTGVGVLVLLYWYCCAGTDGANRFGGGDQVTAKPRRRAAAVTSTMQTA